MATRQELLEAIYERLKNPNMSESRFDMLWKRAQELEASSD